MKFGVHVSIAGGLTKALDRADALGCETLQIFIGNPRGWAASEPNMLEIKEFRSLREKMGLGPLVVHMPYLPNLSTDKPDILKKSVAMAKEQLRLCEQIGAEYLVCHMGKAADPESGMDLMLKSILEVLGGRSRDCMFLIENTAGQGTEMGFEMSCLAELLNRLDRDDVGICLDTCHAHAAGYDLSGPSGFKSLKSDIEQFIDISRLKVIHFNDALKPAGSRVDRHAHIGEGTIGVDGFKRFLRWKAIKDLPGILETPKKTDGDDVRNLAALRSLQPKGRK